MQEMCKRPTRSELEKIIKELKLTGVGLFRYRENGSISFTYKADTEKVDAFKKRISDAGYIIRELSPQSARTSQIRVHPKPKTSPSELDDIDCTPKVKRKRIKIKPTADMFKDDDDYKVRRRPLGFVSVI